MATIGQIIYNVEDYNSSGGYISTANSNVSTIVSSVNYDSFEEYQQYVIDIFEQNLTSLYASGIFLKLGIQAPPGTKIILNDNKQIMIGRTGVYELDEDINITQLKFIRPKKYILDTAATAVELSEGKRLLEEAESSREASLATLDNKYVDKEKDEAYWNEYIEIQNTYEEAYEAALSRYTVGVNGIYVLPSTLNPELDPQISDYEVLYNVIIDFVY